jgi:hypothetical protein
VQLTQPDSWWCFCACKVPLPSTEGLGHSTTQLILMLCLGFFGSRSESGSLCATHRHVLLSLEHDKLHCTRPWGFLHWALVQFYKVSSCLQHKLLHEA